MSFTIILFLVLLAVIIILSLIVFFLSKTIKSNKKEISNLQARLESAGINVQQLAKYVDELQKIKTDEKSISKKIKEAKSDEEVFSIIANIIADNNNRL